MATMQRIGKTATSVERSNGGLVSIRYHSTEVVRVSADGEVTLNTGGWRTVTTKARMNQAANEWGLGFSVYQEAGKWFVAIHLPEKRFASKLPFEDDSITFRVAA